MPLGFSNAKLGCSFSQESPLPISSTRIFYFSWAGDCGSDMQWRAIWSRYSWSAFGLMMSIISWKGVPGFYSPYSDVKSPRMRSYDIFVKLTSGKFDNLLPDCSCLVSVFVVLSTSSSSKSVSRAYLVLQRACLLRCLSIEFLMFLASVDLPIPGKPTGTKKSLRMWFIGFGETRSTTNLNSACSIYSSLHPKGTATSC